VINIKPLRDLVLLKPSSVQLSSQLELISIQNAKPIRSNIGEVLRTGNEAVGIEPGLLVYFLAYSGRELIINEQRLQLVYSRDVLGVVYKPNLVAISAGS